MRNRNDDKSPIVHQLIADSRAHAVPECAAQQISLLSANIDRYRKSDKIV